MPSTKTRLSADDWINAGFAALRARGVGALKAEAMARDVGATKGSFYWHFKDVSDFKRRMAQTWEATVLSELAAAAEEGGNPAQRLSRFGEVVGGSTAPDGTESAMRGWAKSDETALRACNEVDRLRLNYLRAVLGQLGLTNPEFGTILYGALLGISQLPEPVDANTTDTLLAAFLALLRDA